MRCNDLDKKWPAPAEKSQLRSQCLHKRPNNLKTVQVAREERRMDLIDTGLLLNTENRLDFHASLREGRRRCRVF